MSNVTIGTKLAAKRGTKRMTVVTLREGLVQIPDVYRDLLVVQVHRPDRMVTVVGQDGERFVMRMSDVRKSYKVVDSWDCVNGYKVAA